MPRILLVIILGFLVSCGGGGSEFVETEGGGIAPTATPTPTVNPLATATPLANSSPTTTPSFSVSPTPAPALSPTPTATPTPTPTPDVDGIAIRGTIEGLIPGNSLTLQENGSGRTLEVTELGDFYFAEPFDDGAVYDVDVSVQPVGQNCLVSNSTGTISNGEDVTDITVACLGSNGYNLQLSGFQVSPPSLVIGGIRVEDTATLSPVSSLTTSDFNVFENDQQIGDEAYLDSERINGDFVNVSTVLILDISTSIDSAEMLNLKTAAKAALFDDDGVTKTSRLFNEGQEVAIYAFDGEVEMLIDFTDDLDALEAAIDSIPESVLERSNSTNLLGAVEVGLTRWEVDISLNAVDYGYAILLTDGEHNSDGRTADDIVDTFVNDFDVRKDIYAIAVGGGVSTESLTTLTGSSSKLYQIASFDDPEELIEVFNSIRDDAQAQTQGLYRVYYATPKRADSHDVSFRINGNANSAAEVTTTFDADTFTDIEATLFVLIEGGEEQEAGGNLIADNEFMIVEGDLRWANLTASYSLDVSDVVGEDPAVIQLGDARWSFQFPAGFTSATITVIESETGFSGTVTASRESGGVLAESDSSLEDFIAANPPPAPSPPP